MTRGPRRQFPGELELARRSSPTGEPCASSARVRAAEAAVPLPTLPPPMSILYAPFASLLPRLRVTTGGGGRQPRAYRDEPPQMRRPRCRHLNTPPLRRPRLAGAWTSRVTRRESEHRAHRHRSAFFSSRSTSRDVLACQKRKFYLSCPIPGAALRNAPSPQRLQNTSQEHLHSFKQRSPSGDEGPAVNTKCPLYLLALAAAGRYSSLARRAAAAALSGASAARPTPSLARSGNGPGSPHPG